MMMYNSDCYKKSGAKFCLDVQPIDAIRLMPFDLGCAIKYLCRAGNKGGEPEAKDLRKALDYLNDYLDNVVDCYYGDDFLKLDTRAFLALNAYAHANHYIALLFGGADAFDDFDIREVMIEELNISACIRAIKKTLEDLHDE